MSRELEKRVAKLEAKLERNLQIMQKFMDESANRIVKLERRFQKVEKTSTKLNKIADPRKQERNLMKLVDNALKAYDKANKR